MTAPRFWFLWLPGSALGLMLVTPLLSGRVIPASASPALLAIGALVGLGAAIAIAIAWLRRRGAGARALSGALLGLAAPVALALLFLFPRAPVPQRFNDISTDLEDAPTMSVGPNAGKPYPEAFVPWQRAGYPDVQPLRLDAPPARAFALALAAAEAEGWEVLRADAEHGDLQALARTPLFRFEDDVAVRVRAWGGGSRVDVRSKSRFGTGDRGANAARVVSFLERLAETALP